MPKSNRPDRYNLLDLAKFYANLSGPVQSSRFARATMGSWTAAPAKTTRCAH